MDTKLNALLQILKDLPSAVIAFSGGVDSTLLLKSMQLAGVRTLAVTAVSEITPRSDVRDALTFAEDTGIDHMLIETNELSIEHFVSNSPDRCFYCKDALFHKLTELAASAGYQYILEGSMVDDTADYRPGRKAAERHHVRSPLSEAGLHKTEIREISRQLGLSTWNKPSSSCLATRFPYGQRITRQALRRVAQAEEMLRPLGFHTLRVRDHGSIARIELDEESFDLATQLHTRRHIAAMLKSIGYVFISLDLEGYQSGNMNRLIL